MQSFNIGEWKICREDISQIDNEISVPTSGFQSLDILTVVESGWQMVMNL